MFTERVNELFELLGATSTEIAKFAVCDRSLISRIKSGGRLPKPSSVSTAKLINAIFLFADDKNMTDKLCSAVSCTLDNPSPDEIKHCILQYLYEGYKEQPVQIRKHKKTNSGELSRSYGAKLDAVMNIADISNVRFAKMLHIDASAISRFRNGLRTPKSNLKLSEEICNALFERITELNRLGELLRLTKIPPALADDKEACSARFRNWMYDFEEKDNSIIVEELIENISSFSSDIKIPLPTFKESAPESILAGQENTYFGTEGLRRAVIRFLGNAIKKGAKEFLLYSDQNMDWLTKDMSFRLKWSALMRECISHGIRIRIIHNLNRDIGEMTSAINNWLPLYMSGMIESFYCKRQAESNFSHTIFLCPHHACISSVHVSGNEDGGIYHYDTNENLLGIFYNEYKKLLEISKPLVWIYKTFENIKTAHLNFNGFTSLSGMPSTATMPQQVLYSVLSRNAVDDNTSRQIILEQKHKKQIFRQNLKNSYVHECITLPEDEALFDGKIPIDIQGTSLTYTPQEFKEHIKNILRNLEKYSNYKIFLLPETPFSNVSLLISENFVAATRFCSPFVTFWFSHPQMCEAFLGYSKSLKEQYTQDKNTVRRKLERYL